MKKPESVQNDTPQSPTSQSAPASSGSGLAVASLILGILSLTGFGLLLGIPAIITGIMALRRSTADRGLSWAGIITGTISTVLSILFLLLVALFIIIGIVSTNNVGEYGEGPDLPPIGQSERA